MNSGDLLSLLQRTAVLRRDDDEAAASLVAAVTAAAAEQRPDAAGATLLGPDGIAATQALALAAPSQSALWLELVTPVFNAPLPSSADAAVWWTLLIGPAGLTSQRWHARAAAAPLIASLASAAPSAVPPTLAAELLLVKVAHTDVRREVRVAALLAGAALLAKHCNLTDNTLLLAALLAGGAEGDAAVDAAAEQAVHKAPPSFADNLRSSLVAAAEPGDAESSTQAAVLLFALKALLDISGGDAGIVDVALMDALSRLVQRAAVDRYKDAVTAALQSVAHHAPDVFLTWLAAASCRPSPDAALRAAVAAGGLQGSRTALLAAIHVLLASLQPPRSVFGADSTDANAVSAFANSAALRLAVLQQLLNQLPGRALPPLLPPPGAGGAWTVGAPGCEDGGELPGAAAALMAASYCCGGSLAPNADAGQGLPPWSSPAVASAGESLLASLAPAASRELLLCASLAARGLQLRAALLVPDIGAPYSPSTPTGHEATVAAQTLRASLSSVGHPAASAAVSVVMPLLLLALEHTSSPTRGHAQRCLRHLLGVATRTSVRRYGDVLWPAAMAGLPACDAASWPPAVAAATALADVLGGNEPTAQQLHALLVALLDDAHSHPGDLHRLLPMLRGAPVLLRSLRLEALRHTLRLVPLLAETLECDAAADAALEAREAAALALTVLLERCWPRAHHHAPRLWPAVLHGYRLAPAGLPGSPTRAALERAAEQLLAAGGESSLAALRASIPEHQASELAGLLRLVPAACLPAASLPLSDTGAAGKAADETGSMAHADVPAEHEMPANDSHVASVDAALSPLAVPEDDDDDAAALSEPEGDVAAWIAQLAVDG